MDEAWIGRQARLPGHILSERSSRRADAVSAAQADHRRRISPQWLAAAAIARARLGATFAAGRDIRAARAASVLASPPSGHHYP